MHRRAYLLIKWTLVILYAVLIRQLVICPCFAAKFLTTRRTLFSHDSAASMGAANSALEYDAKSYAGDVVLVALLCFHLGLLIFGIYLATESTLEEDTEVRSMAAPQTGHEHDYDHGVDLKNQLCAQLPKSAAKAFYKI